MSDHDKLTRSEVVRLDEKNQLFNAGEHSRKYQHNALGDTKVIFAEDPETQVHVDVKGDLNIVHGGNMADRLSVRGKENVLRGHDGNDKILSLEGNNVIDAGAGDDALLSSGGNDHLTGGEGADHFHIIRTTRIPDDKSPVILTDFSPLEGDQLRVDIPSSPVLSLSTVDEMRRFFKEQDIRLENEDEIVGSLKVELFQSATQTTVEFSLEK